MNIKNELLHQKALRCAQQLENLRDLRGQLLNEMETFRLYLEQLEHALPHDQRQPIIALLQDVKAEMQNVYAVQLDDMHYGLDEVLIAARKGKLA